MSAIQHVLKVEMEAAAGLAVPPNVVMLEVEVGVIVPYQLQLTSRRPLPVSEDQS